MPTNMPVVSIDITIVWQIINFVVLMFIFKKFLLTPIGDFLEKRRKGIEDKLNNAEKNKEEAQKKMDEAERLIKEGKRKSQERITESIRKGEAEKDRILKEAHQVREKMIKAAETDIANMKMQAKKELRSEMTEIAVKLAEKMIKRTIDENTEKELANDFISEIGDSE